MKVKLATQVFSHTVHAAIQTVVDTCGFKKNSKEIASSSSSFIKKINQFFDCLNSKSLHSKNIYKSAIQLNNVPHQFLKDFTTYLDHMEFVDEKKKVFFLDGLKLTLNSILQLADELLKNNPHNFFIMTRALNQDKLENSFSVLRQKGGNNNNPSVSEINNILARLMAAKIVQLSSNTNCEEIEDTTLQTLSTILEEQNEQEEGKIVEESTAPPMENMDTGEVFVSDDFIDYQQVSTDEVSLRYFLGYIIRKMMPKINCEQCEAQLKKEEEVMSAPSELFIFNKNYTNMNDFGSLIAPSQNFYEVSKAHILIFDNYFKNAPEILCIKQKIKEKCFKSTPEWFSTCYNHKEKILDYLILILLRKHCLWSTSDNNKAKQRKLKILS